MATEDEINVTKLEAAQRQLRTAIALWFTDGDPVAIHTLAHAAHEILHRLFRNKGLSDLVFDSTLINPEYQHEYKKLLTSNATFFKHANREGQEDAATTFDTSLNYMFMVMSVAALQRIGAALGDEELALRHWLECHKPHLFTEEIGKERIPIETAEKWRQLSGIEFFEAFKQGRALRRERSHGH